MYRTTPAPRLWIASVDRRGAGHPIGVKRLDSLPWHWHPGHPGVTVPVRADPLGLWGGPTPQNVRSKAWRRLGGGWFVPADVDADAVDQRIVEAAMALPDHGAVTGWADLRWRGARWFDGLAGDGSHPLRVPIVIAGGDVRQTDRLATSKERLLPTDIEVVDGLRVTRAVRSVLFEMRYASSVRLAVRAMDMAAFSDQVSIAEAKEYVTDYLSGWTGAPRARAALALADENAWSVREVDMRLVWQLDAGLPRPLCNRPIFDLDGHHIGTPDLLDPEVGLIGEYDGHHHLEAHQRAHDIVRESDFRKVDLETVTMLATDGRDPRGFVERLQRAYARASARPQHHRGWTIDAPEGWTLTDTVERRRQLTADKQFLLRHRRLAA